VGSTVTRENDVKFARQVSSVLLTRAAVIALVFLTGIIVVRSVGPEGKGALTVLASLVALVSVIAGFGLATGGVYLYKAKRYSIGTITGVSVLVWAIALALCAVLIGVGGDAVLRRLLNLSAGETLNRTWVWLSFATLPALMLSVLIQSIWVTDNRMRLYAGVNLGSQALGLALAWALVVRLQWGVTGALAANLGAQCLTLAVSLAWLRSLGEPGRFRSLKASFRPVIRASHGAYLNGIVAIIFKQGEAVLLAVLLNLHTVGHYGVALNFYQLLTEAPRAVVWPLVGRMTDVGASAADEAARGIRMIPIALLPPLMALVAISPLLIRVFYGDEFAPSGVLLAYMAPGVLFRSIHLVVYSYLVVVGRLQTIAPCVAAAAAANLLLDVLVVPRWGLDGVAVSNVVSELILAVLSVAVFLKETRGRLATVIVRRSDFEDLSRQIGRAVRAWRS
jgi:O-antigen/teichoic acid export membrane protein